MSPAFARGTREVRWRPMVKRADLEPQIISQWLKRPAGKRKDIDVLLFYGELSKDYRISCRSGASGDKYQHLKSILRNHIERGAL